MQTKQQIMQVALKLFIKNGYERTSLTDIAKQIGITKPAIYYHFESKEILFLAVMHSFLDQLEKMLAEVNAVDTSAQETIRAMFATLKDVKSMMALFYDDGLGQEDAPEFHTYMLMIEGTKLFPEIRQRINAFYTLTNQLITQKVIQAQTNGEIRPDINPETFAFQISATIEGAILISIFNSDIDMEKMSQSMFQNTWTSIKT